jgi:N-acyl-D-aspartate/D-glutamate deacylase
MAMDHTLEMIRWAKETEVDVAFDIIPHDWNHTSVSSILPPWAFEGGTEKLLHRLGNRKTREEMKKNPKPIWQLVPAGRWNDIVLFRSKSNKDLIGLTFEEIGQKRNTDPYDVVFDLLLEEGVDFQGLMWASHGFSESDIRLCMKHSECGVISDTMALAPYGELKDSIGSLSGYGWIARFFRKYVREEKLIRLEDAVHKVTGLPAARLGLTDRGHLYPGAMADIAIFDLNRIENRTTLMSPTEYPAGIGYVLVNGRIVMDKGHRTPVNPGRVIRRNHQ